MKMNPISIRLTASFLFSNLWHLGESCYCRKRLLLLPKINNDSGSGSGFFKKFWLRIRVRKSAESCRSWLRHFGSVATSDQGRIQGGRLGYCEVHFISLAVHKSIVKYTSFLLQYWTRNETWLSNIIEIAPPLTLLAGFAPASDIPWRM